MSMETAELLLKKEVIPNGLYKVWQPQVNNITLIFEPFHVNGGFQERKKIDCTPYYNFNAWVFEDLSQLINKRNTIEWTAAPSYQIHAVDVSYVCLETSQLHGIKPAGDLGGNGKGFMIVKT